MRNLFKNFYVFSIIFLLNFISIFFIWIKRKFGDVSLENIFYHFNSFFDGNILLPDHHLEESLVYYVININFLFSSFIFLFWFILKKFSDDRSSKSILNFINMISKVFINYYLIWIFLILVLGFSLFSFLKNINELNSKTSFLGKDYKKIEISNLNNINNKNLILIYVESLDQNFRNFDNQNLLPSFSKLQTQYLNVNKFEQLKSIDWTIAGIFSSQCGIPLIDYSVLNKNINCLPDILKKNSYKNFFVIGHESKFQNLNTFLSNHNYDKIIDKKFIETNYNYVNQNTG